MRYDRHPLDPVTVKRADEIVLGDMVLCFTPAGEPVFEPVIRIDRDVDGGFMFIAGNDEAWADFAADPDDRIEISP